MMAADPTPRGLYLVPVTHGLTTASDLLSRLGALPAGAVVMSASGDDDDALLELVDFAVPFAPGGGA